MTYLMLNFLYVMLNFMLFECCPEVVICRKLSPVQFGHRSNMSSHTYGVKSNHSIVCFVHVCSQECESAAGELRAGPDLHHRENHLRLLPQRRGGAELCRQPARSGLHAAFQTWTQLPGTVRLISHKQKKSLS